MTTATISPKSKSVAAKNDLPRRPAKTSLHAAMNRFYDRDDAKLTVGTRQDYEHLLMMLEVYLDDFGIVMLRAAGAKPTFARSKAGSASKSYDPASLAHFFRGFVLFFLKFKVSAPEEKKVALVRIMEEFVVWLRQKGHLPKDFESDFLTIDSRSIHRATQATTVLSNALRHSKFSRKNMEEIHNGEPLYMVSRIKSGKLWFVYYTDGGYDEFGPVSVPFGVSDNLSPGWLIDCEFGKYDGRWQITTMNRILPV